MVSFNCIARSWIQSLPLLVLLNQFAYLMESVNRLRRLWLWRYNIWLEKRLLWWSDWSCYRNWFRMRSCRFGHTLGDFGIGSLFWLLTHCWELRCLSCGLIQIIGLSYISEKWVCWFFLGRGTLSTVETDGSWLIFNCRLVLALGKCLKQRIDSIRFLEWSCCVDNLALKNVSYLNLLLGLSLVYCLVLWFVVEKTDSWRSRSLLLLIFGFWVSKQASAQDRRFSRLIRLFCLCTTVEQTENCWFFLLLCRCWGWSWNITEKACLGCLFSNWLLFSIFCFLCLLRFLF